MMASSQLTSPPLVKAAPNKFWRYLPIVGGILAVGLLLFGFNPTECRWFPSCIFHKVTGLYCPGCGSTRAVYKLVHGDVIAAMRFNPLVVIGLSASGLSWWWWRKTTVRVKTTVGWMALVVALLFGVLRNLPFAQFALLRP